MEFDIPKDTTAIIKVIGVGGGGSNAVNHMFKQGIYGVDFIVCNTDRQSLDSSPVPIKIQLGADSTSGRGAGSTAGAIFLKRFIKNTTWMHLDIAGVTWAKSDRPMTPKGGSGFGVRLLEELVYKNFK